MIVLHLQYKWFLITKNKNRHLDNILKTASDIRIELDLGRHTLCL